MVEMMILTPPRTLAELRNAVGAGQIPTSSAASVLAFLDLTQRVIGDKFAQPDVLASEATFAAHLPREPDAALAAAFGDAALYNRCRASLLRHCKLAGLWPDDPYTLLNRLAREIGAPGVNERLLSEHFPGCLPGQITRDLAIAADRPLRGMERQGLRRSLAVLDQLRSRVTDIGLLGPEIIGPLPIYRDGDKLPIDLPQDLAPACAVIPADDARRARRAFELATDLEVLTETGSGIQRALTDVGARTYLAAISDKISPNMAAIYLRALISLLRASDPGSVPADLTTDRIKRPERYLVPDAENTAPVRKTDRSSPALPTQIEYELADFAKARPVSRKRMNTLRKIMSATVCDAQSGDYSSVFSSALSRFDDLFPDLADITRRDYRSVFRSFLKHTGRLTAWDELRARAKSLALTGLDDWGLSYLERLACARDPELTPARIDRKLGQVLVETARAQGCGVRLAAGLKSLDQLRPALPDLLPGEAIGSVQDRRKRGNLDLPAALETALRANAEASGFTKAGTRAILVAVRKLFSLTEELGQFDADLSLIPWMVLLNRAVADHPDAMAPYRLELTRLAERLAGKMSKGWRELEQAVVVAGISRVENPVQALAEIASEQQLEPWQLDRDWAWIHERGLRPDLRLTWARNVDRLDALREVPAIAGSGLLPIHPLGPMPPRGSRIKHAVYPLPRQFNAAIEGESKQVLEAAHFAWRCLRDLGVYHRGDDPAPRDLVAEAQLSHILEGQSVMSHRAAKEMLARIRDWRESGIGPM